MIIPYKEKNISKRKILVFTLEFTIRTMHIIYNRDLDRKVEVLFPFQHSCVLNQSILKIAN